MDFGTLTGEKKTTILNFGIRQITYYIGVSRMFSKPLQDDSRPIPFCQDLFHKNDLLTEHYPLLGFSGSLLSPARHLLIWQTSKTLHVIDIYVIYSTCLTDSDN